MNAQDIYQQWLSSPYIDENTKKELRSINEQTNEIEDRFYKQLQFGTGGLRGVLGAGTNRINRYTIRRATQGLANYIFSFGEAAKRKGVVIAYDSRHQSAILAGETANTLVANGINAYLFDALRPTPELSFAVRHLKAQAGIVITASHNPPEYNGYKVYWEDGGQVATAIADEITAEIEKLGDFTEIHTVSDKEANESNLFHYIGKEIDEEYLSALEKVRLNADAVKTLLSPLTVVYTPLHGAGNVPVQQILKRIGVINLHVVPEQELPDPNFSTVKSPNPEESEAFRYAVALATEKNADLIIGTDPDCDRVGVVVRNASGDFQLLNGNQTGALLLHYILSQLAAKGSIPKGATVIKTIVTSEFGKAIAKKYGVETIDTLTGFKYIAEKIKQLEENNERTFVFGYEESYGYLADTAVRDKDAVMAAMLVTEMAAYYKGKGSTLTDVLAQLYQELGYYVEALESRTLKGKDGQERIRKMMEDWRSMPPVQVAGEQLMELRDYQLQQCREFLSGAVTAIDLPKENVLYYAFADGSWFCMRPSGTEPKMKIYFSVIGKTQEKAMARLQSIKNEVMERIDCNF